MLEQHDEDFALNNKFGFYSSEVLLQIESLKTYRSIFYMENITSRQRQFDLSYDGNFQSIHRESIPFRK